MGDITVVTPAVRRGLTTVARYRDTAPETELLDAQVELLIGQATARAEAYCNRVFASERVIETFWVAGDVHLFLTRLPVTTVHTVALNDTPLNAPLWRLEDRSAGLVKLAGSTRALNDAFYAAIGTGSYGWPINVRDDLKIEVDYTGGWIMPDGLGFNLPADLEEAGQVLVRDLVERQAATRLDITAEKLGDASWTYGQQVGKGGASPGETLAMATLDRYRIVPI